MESCREGGGLESREKGVETRKRAEDYYYVGSYCAGTAPPPPPTAHIHTTNGGITVGELRRFLHYSGYTKPFLHCNG